MINITLKHCFHGKWACSRSTDSLDCFQTKWSDSRSALPTDSHTSPPPPLTRGGNDEHDNLKRWPSLMTRLDIHKRTSLFLSLNWHLHGLRVCATWPSLDTDKLFPVNRRAITGHRSWDSCLKSKVLHHWSPQTANPCCAHGWTWFVHNVQPAGTDVRSKPQQDCQQAKCYARADPVMHHRLYSN